MFGGHCSENMKKIVVKLLYFAWIAILFSGCATYSEQIGKKFVDEKPTTQSEVLHEIVALGNFAATDESTVQIAKAVKDYFAEAGRRLGINTMYRYSEKFGLGEKTGVEISESTGTLAGRDSTTLPTN